MPPPLRPVPSSTENSALLFLTLLSCDCSVADNSAVPSCEVFQVLRTLTSIWAIISRTLTLNQSECPPSNLKSQKEDVLIVSLLNAIRYVDDLGCQGADLNRTSDYYARYTTTVLCNGIVQDSKKDCGLSDQQARPICADTCVSISSLLTLRVNVSDDSS